MIKLFMAAAEQALEETIKVSLGGDARKQNDESPMTIDFRFGWFVPLIGEDVQAQVGIVTTEDGSKELARKLMGAEPESAADEADAVGEIVNIIAGVIKRRVDDKNLKLKLGLPFGFKGEIHFKEPVQIVTSNYVCCEKPVLLTVILKQKEK